LDLLILLGQLVLIEVCSGTFLQNYLYKWSTVYETNWILQVELDSLLKLSGLIEVKGIVHAKLKNLSSFTHPHVVPISFDFWFTLYFDAPL